VGRKKAGIKIGKRIKGKRVEDNEEDELLEWPWKVFGRRGGRIENEGGLEKEENWGEWIKEIEIKRKQ
jgi:hypothetical protein